MRCLALMRLLCELVAAHLHHQFSAWLWREIATKQIPTGNFADDVIAFVFLELWLDVQLLTRPEPVPTVDDMAVFHQDRLPQSACLNIGFEFLKLAAIEFRQPVRRWVNGKREVVRP